MSAEPSWLELIKSFSCICANSIGTNCWLSLSGLGCKDGCTYLRERWLVRAWRMQCTARTDAVHCRGGCSALRERMQCTASEMGITEEPILRRTALQADVWWGVYIRGRCPRLLIVVPSRHQSACGFSFYHGFNGLDGLLPMRGWEQDKNQKNPLARIEGVALMLCFRSGLIRASS